MNTEDRITAALGERPADLLIRNARVVNTLSGEIHAADVAVAGGRFLGFGHYEARTVVDAAGCFLCPGLIDGHIHIESTLLCPPEFARAVAGRGTCAVVADPHEIANVLGMAGIDYMLQAGRDLPVAIYFMMPSCVPATHLETSGARLTARDIERALADHPGRILGLAEMMNVPGVLHRDPGVLAKLRAAAGRPVDGHAPGLTGRPLNAYVAAGPGSDHESTTLEEGLEKLRLGMFLMLREGTSEQNLKALAPLARSCDTARMGLVTDDRHPTDLLSRGHMDHCVRRAMELGVPPVRAVQMASLNTARHFGLAHRGAVAPGYHADFLLLDDLERFAIREVYLGGENLRDMHWPETTIPPPGQGVHLPHVRPSRFEIPAGRGGMRVIGLVSGQILTRSLTVSPQVSHGLVQADPESDLAKLAVIERHRGTGNTGLGFVKGLGLRAGAVASTVAHDSHNLIVAGMDDADMALAANHAATLGGGLVAGLDGQVLESLPLPVAGLFREHRLEAVVAHPQRLETDSRPLGTPIPGLFLILSFLALPVIPALKLTDLGLVDVNAFDFTPLWTDTP